MTAPGYLTDCETRTIDLTNGADEDLWLDVTDKRHNDITAATVEIALAPYGTPETPGTWHPADQVEQNGEVWQIRAALRIGGSLVYPLAVYWAWTRTTTVEGEVIPERAENLLVAIV